MGESNLSRVKTENMGESNLSRVKTENMGESNVSRVTNDWQEMAELIIYFGRKIKLWETILCFLEFDNELFQMIKVALDLFRLFQTLGK